MSKARRKARAPMTPGYEGRYEPGRSKVSDPYEPGKMLDVEINAAHDVLLHWRSRSMIDDAQFLAGQRFQGIYSRAEIGGARSMDHTQPKVDGGRIPHPFSDAMMIARAELVGVRDTLGDQDYGLMIRIVGEGMQIAAESRRWGGRQPALYIGRRVRDALTALADFWGSGGPRIRP